MTIKLKFKKMSDVIISIISSLTGSILGVDTEPLLAPLPSWIKYSLLLAIPLFGWVTVFILDSPILFSCLWILLTLIGVSAERINAESSSNNSSPPPLQNQTQEITNSIHIPVPVPVESQGIQNKPIISSVKKDTDGENVEPDVGSQTDHRKLPQKIEIESLTHIKVISMNDHLNHDHKEESLTDIVASVSSEKLQENSKKDQDEPSVDEEATWIFPKNKVYEESSFDNQSLDKEKVFIVKGEEIETIDLDSTTNIEMLNIEKDLLKRQNRHHTLYKKLNLQDQDEIVTD